MEELIPLFPLKIVAFPNEMLNLHIFEPRYKQLLNDIFPGPGRFGLPPYIDNRIEIGTLMEVTEITRTYDDGRMDIKTKGLKIFKVLEYNNPYAEKKYSAGTISYIENHFEQDPLQKGYMVERLEEFYRCIHYNSNLSDAENLLSYDIAHHLGLTIEEEYKLLKLDREMERQQYITEYLDKVIPILRRTDKAREIIKLNGHFKYFDPIDF